MFCACTIRSAKLINRERKFVSYVLCVLEELHKPNMLALLFYMCNYSRF